MARRAYEDRDLSWASWDSVRCELAVSTNLHSLGRSGNAGHGNGRQGPRPSLSGRGIRIRAKAALDRIPSIGAATVGIVGRT